MKQVDAQTTLSTKRLDDVDLSGDDMLFPWDDRFFSKHWPPVLYPNVRSKWNESVDRILPSVPSRLVAVVVSLLGLIIELVRDALHAASGILMRHTQGARSKIRLAG
jgi:hypothetical protein